MRVLIYSEAFAPKIGGVETIVMLLAKGLTQDASSPEHGFTEVTVVTHVGADGMDDSQLPFRVVRKPNFTGLVRLLRHSDVIHLAGPCFVPLALGLLFRKPVVVEHHGFQAICPNGQLLYDPAGAPCPGHFMAGRHRECLRCNAAQGKLRSLKMWLWTFPRRWLCQRAAANILPTEWLGTLLQLNRMATIPHGLSPASISAITRVAPQVPTFAFLGRLVSTKGSRTLLDAAQQLKAKGLAFRIKIIGQGPEREMLEQQARDLQIQDCVQFLGYIPIDQLQESLADTTAVIMPSLAGEVFGLAAAENMQRGRTVIVSDIGALAEVVGDAGIKFPPGDAVGLARCMETVLANPLRAEELGRRGRERALRLFQSKGMIDAHATLYREIIRR